MSLNSRETALISIGVSVGVNCQPCLQYCVAKAKEIGMTEQDIRDAVNAGKVVRSGAANKMNRYIEELLKDTSTVPEAAEKGCECGCGEN